MLNIMRLKQLIPLVFCILYFTSDAQVNNKAIGNDNGFKIIPLGVKGGLDE